MKKCNSPISIDVPCSISVSASSENHQTISFASKHDTHALDINPNPLTDVRGTHLLWSWQPSRCPLVGQQLGGAVMALEDGRKASPAQVSMIACGIPVVMGEAYRIWKWTGVRVLAARNAIRITL